MHKSMQKYSNVSDNVDFGIVLFHLDNGQFYVYFVKNGQIFQTYFQKWPKYPASTVINIINILKSFFPEVDLLDFRKFHSVINKN